MWVLNRLRVAVVAQGRGVEYDAAVEEWHIGLDTLRHLYIPEFKLTAVGVFPVSIQVDEHIDATLKIHRDVMIEVRMNRKVSTLSNLMEAAAEKVGVRDKAFDARNVLDDLNERPGIECVEELTRRAWQAVRREASLQPLLSSVECFLGTAGAWKVNEAPVEQCGRKKIIDRYVRKGLSSKVLLG
jgi:hypothetical protein